ncbi:MAG: hypothetical protein HYW47_07145 [Deltaproteobacteria bacterium]|nr:hypothetical protein [Deltaproteobacteria bacterium]
MKKAYGKKNLKHKSKSNLKKIELHSYQGSKTTSGSSAKDLRHFRRVK